MNQMKEIILMKSMKILSIGSAGIIYILIYIAESYFPIQKEEAIRVAGEAYAFSQLVYNLWLKDSNKEPDKSVSL